MELVGTTKFDKILESKEKYEKLITLYSVRIVFLNISFCSVWAIFDLTF